jgi:hypothetical protein
MLNTNLTSVASGHGFLKIILVHGITYPVRFFLSATAPDMLTKEGIRHGKSTKTTLWRVGGVALSGDYGMGDRDGVGCAFTRNIS